MRPANAARGDPTVTGSRTAPEIEEQVIAMFAVRGSVAAVARATGVPRTTCSDILARADQDELAAVRRRHREDLICEAQDIGRRLLRRIRRSGFGSEHSSEGLEAARALESVGRFVASVASVDNRRERDREQEPPAPTVMVIDATLPADPAALAAHDAGGHAEAPDQDCPECRLTDAQRKLAEARNEAILALPPS
jgi:hypothetical protein